MGIWELIILAVPITIIGNIGNNPLGYGYNGPGRNRPIEITAKYTRLSNTLFITGQIIPSH